MLWLPLRRSLLSVLLCQLPVHLAQQELQHLVWVKHQLASGHQLCADTLGVQPAQTVQEGRPALLWQCMLSVLVHL
jgi:hypothetical protein